MYARIIVFQFLKVRRTGEITGMWDFSILYLRVYFRIKYVPQTKTSYAGFSKDLNN